MPASESKDLRAAVAHLRHLLTQIDPAEGQWCCGPIEYPKAEAIERVSRYLGEGGEQIHAVYVERDGEALITALTGNAQYGEAHADFIATIRNWLPGLLTHIENTLEAHPDGE